MLLLQVRWYFSNIDKQVELKKFIMATKLLNTHIKM